jgi:hypothetical protein
MNIGKRSLVIPTGKIFQQCPNTRIMYHTLILPFYILPSILIFRRSKLSEALDSLGSTLFVHSVNISLQIVGKIPPGF